MARRLPILILLAVLPSPCPAQWIPQASGTKARLRGASAPGDRVAWASGTGGTFVRTVDGGETWKAGVVAGAEALDFRDVHAFGADSALLLSIGDGEKSRIYRTVDGGSSWSMAYLNKDPKVFLDAIAMRDGDRGLVLGDPVDGKYTLLSTRDGGKTWDRIPPDALPSSLPGEGAFAASGTCLVATPKGYAFGTGGGPVARVFRTEDDGKSWTAYETPIRAGNASSGIFSLAFRDPDHGVAVGGDYKAPDAPGVVALTSDGGRTWRVPTGKPPGGYRSAVVYVRGEGRSAIVAVGPTGGDVSLDDGETWRPLGPTGYHALVFSDRSPAGWAVGEDGRIGKFNLEILTRP